MKKISLLIKTIFYVYNIGLIVIYLYPGSIVGWFMWRFSKTTANIHKYNCFIKSCIGFFYNYYVRGTLF